METRKSQEVFLFECQILVEEAVKKGQKAAYKGGWLNGGDKMNDKIRNKTGDPYKKIYSVVKARRLYDKKIHTPRKLSLMKQENIKKAVLGKFDLENVQEAISDICGFCFKFRELSILEGNCFTCPILKKLGKKCYELPTWRKMHDSETKKQFITAHKKWCKKIGLDVYKKRG